ncbi:MAG: LuxR C-terminal-related transcriptional regulator [Actinomycetota bacterium]|nr:LuxR C-terminal-related transcriptional regulator [Actinomycetota bacterium]
MLQPRRPGNLPAETTSFVGRRGELAEIKKRLAAGRLVSLVGPGGVGKTRLAIRAATDLGRGFPGGVWMVELAEIGDQALVGNAVLAALDLRDQAAVDPTTLLRSYLSDKELLLVVDNCEHVLPAVAHLVNDLLRAAPGVRVLATSREPLSTAGEQVLPVPSLRLPPPDDPEPPAQLRFNEAVQLFVERAAAASGSFELTADNHAAVVELCRRLDGLPLAIELAAVRTRALSPQQIRDRLSDRFELLTTGDRTALPRHQTLRTSVEWSYDLLSPTERRLLARLCVFAARFTLDDAEAVCGGGDVPAALVLDLLSSLLDKSLLVMEEDSSIARYRLHETVREYARLRLREAGEEETVERRCFDHYLARCRRFAAEGRSSLPQWLPWMDQEIDNIRATLHRRVDQGDTRRGLELATSLIWYWITRATTEGVRWLDRLLVSDPEPGAHPWAYFARGFLGVLQNDPAAAAPVLDRAVTSARATGQREVLAQSLAMASIAASMSGDRATSIRLLEEARTVNDTLDDLGAALMTRQAQALNGLLTGDLDAVGSASAEGVRLSREAGDLYSLGMMLMNQGLAALLRGDQDESRPLFTESLRLARRLDDRVAQCYLLGGLAAGAAAAGEPLPAARLLGATETLRAEVGATINAVLAPALAHATATAQASLGVSRYRSEFAAGQGLSRQSAIRLALRESDPVVVSRDNGGTGVLRPREAEVARLIAGGLTNREIGGRLFISERTVESHVRNILNKLGFNTRAQIAGWMSASDR